MNFLAASLWLLMCTAMMSQAAPMVNTEITQPGQTVSVSSNVDLANQPPSPILPPESTQSLGSQPEQCPPQTVPCPEQTQPLTSTQPDGSSGQKPSPEKKTQVVTGWMNGAKNMCKFVYQSVSAFFVGEKGVLTNLVYTTGTPPAKNKKSNNNRRNEGNVTTCCAIFKNAPSRKDDDQQQNEQDPESARQTNIKIPSLSLACTKIQQNSVPGAPIVIPNGQPVPTAPSDTTNCCCVGTNNFIFRKICKLVGKFNVNVCGITVNVTGAEAN